MQKSNSKRYDKNQEITIEIEDIGSDGAGIGKVEGYAIFVKDTVPGDEVLVKITKAKKNYAFARLVKVLKESPLRITPPCESASTCGGCQIQNIKYEAQLEFKENKVRNNLIRLGKFSEEQVAAVMEPIVGMDDPYRYRNKAQFPFGLDNNGKTITGFYAGRTHAIIPTEDCLIGIEENKDILEVILTYMKKNGVKPYNEQTREGLIRHVLIRKGFTTDQLMVCPVINGDKMPAINQLVANLQKIPGMTSISYSINKENTNVIMGREVKTIFGPGYIEDYIGDIKFQISPSSFYQVNPVQTKKLYDCALDYADLKGSETVWDLYCGIGTISLFLSQKAKQVYGIEIVEDAIIDAKNNAKINGIENAEFYVGKVEEVLPKMWISDKKSIDGVKKGDVIMLDPPRKGCDPRCLETILDMKPDKIVYVSCDSATLARDLEILCEKDYKLEKARCYDMFPHTVHVETVVGLKSVETRNR